MTSHVSDASRVNVYVCRDKLWLVYLNLFWPGEGRCEHHVIYMLPLNKDYKDCQSGWEIYLSHGQHCSILTRSNCFVFI